MSAYRRYRKRAALHFMAFVKRWIKQNADKARSVEGIDPTAQVNSQLKQIERGRRIDIR